MNTSTHETRPHLVIISGAPASGKSTLAERLSHELRYPLLAKDAVKELLADTWGALDHAGSRALGLASIRLLYDTASRLLGAGDDVIIESNFYRGISEPDLAPLVARSRAVLIHCQASIGIIMQRYVERDASGNRHAVHVHGDYLAALAPKLAAGVFEPPALGVPLVRVDTSDGYAPSFAEIIERLQADAEHTPSF